MSLPFWGPFHVRSVFGDEVADPESRTPGEDSREPPGSLARSVAPLPQTRFLLLLPSPCVRVSLPVTSGFPWGPQAEALGQRAAYPGSTPFSQGISVPRLEQPGAPVQHLVHSRSAGKGPALDTCGWAVPGLPGEGTLSRWMGWVRGSSTAGRPFGPGSWWGHALWLCGRQTKAWGWQVGGQVGVSGCAAPGVALTCPLIYPISDCLLLCLGKPLCPSCFAPVRVAPSSSWGAVCRVWVRVCPVWCW